MADDGKSCYISFILHKTMRDAKSKISNLKYNKKAVDVSADDITRTELVETALNVTIEEDSAPPLSFFMSRSEVKNNLVIMIFVWLITVFDFYLIGFLVNTFD